jgi:SpoVK/Ycf46/Vps4 family AAA+-type ATPase
MQNSEDAVRALREALRASPDNVPLRQHLADTLLGAGRAGEAEVEYRQALAQAPDDRRLKMGLAGAFYGQGKYAEALVLVESLIQGGEVPPRTYLLHARLLLRLGETERAGHQYRRALEFDPSLADEDLASRLGITRSSPPTSSAAGQPSGEDPFVVQGRMREAWAETLGGEGQTTTEVERPRLSFADVGGMESLKEEIRLKIIYPLTHPDLYRAYGKAAGGGILMYGPPGCGKTHLARATAGEIKAGFIAVGIDDVLDMWIGNSEKNLHALFDQARRAAPCVLFFDEVDALGASRTDMRRSGGRTQINQFLAEFDGVEHSNEGVLILAATNAPWHLDPAFRRPGRFDRILFVPPPDASARAAILRLLCQGKPQNDVDFEALARRTEGFSGADLKAVVDVAVEGKLRQALQPRPPRPGAPPASPAPAGVPQPLVTRDLQGALGTVRPSTKEWFATARNYALYANQGGAYDDVLAYLKLNKA